MNITVSKQLLARYGLPALVVMPVLLRVAEEAASKIDYRPVGESEMSGFTLAAAAKAGGVKVVKARKRFAPLRKTGWSEASGDLSNEDANGR